MDDFGFACGNSFFDPEVPDSYVACALRGGATFFKECHAGHVILVQDEGTYVVTLGDNKIPDVKALIC